MYDIPGVLNQVDDRTWSDGGGRETKLPECYKGKGEVERHDRLPHEMTRHIKRKRIQVILRILLV